MAYENKIPFVVAAPTTSIDLNHKTEDITIEEREPEEITYVKGYDEKKKEFRRAKLYSTNRAKNPVFDITPAKYMSKIGTEKQIIQPPFNLKKQLK